MSKADDINFLLRQRQIVRRHNKEGGWEGMASRAQEEAAIIRQLIELAPDYRLFRSWLWMAEWKSVQGA